MEGRPGVDAGPSDAAVGRAVHHVLPGGQATAAFVHRRHVNPATALQVAGDLDVAEEAGVEWTGRPSGAVVGVDDVECAAVDGEVVVGDIHPPVEGAGRVVVDPHALAVVADAVVGARSGSPGNAVRRGPEADALAAAAGRQVAGEPHTQALRCTPRWGHRSWCRGRSRAAGRHAMWPRYRSSRRGRRSSRPNVRLSL